MVFAVFPQSTGEDQLLRLRDGRVLVCEILDHDFDGLDVQALRTGGKFRLGWNDLFPGESDRLKANLGYRIDTSVPEVQADKLLLVNGQVLIGRVIARDGFNVELQVHENRSLIPLIRLAAPPEPVMVPAPQVLTPEQFYQERSVDVSAEDALAQFAFALELQNVFALDRALEVLSTTRELATANGDSALLSRVGNLESSVELTRDNRVQAEALEYVRQLIHRNRFAVAEEKLEEFGQLNPDSPLEVDYRDLLDRFDGDRERAMVQYLSRNWFSTVSSILKKRALDRGASVDELMTWAESEVPQLVRTTMAEELETFHDQVRPDAVDGFWQQRTSQGAKRHHAGYGNGSWILGEDEARAGLDPANEEIDDGKTPEQRELEERTQRYIQNLERARRKAAGDEEASPEDWWRKSSANQRFQWLLAYYAEKSGDYELTHVSFSNCGTCAGSGIIRSLDLGSAGSRERKAKCPTCLGVGVRRSVTFR